MRQLNLRLAITFLILILLCGAATLVAFAQSQTSNPATFTVVAQPAAPTITTIAPTSAYAGASALTLIVTGTNYISGCTVNFDSTVLSTTFGSATSLTAALPSSLIKLGTHQVTVVCSLPLLSMNSPVTLPNAQVGVTYSQNLISLMAIKGGKPPYSVSLSSGKLPIGLSLSSSGILSGVAGSAGAASLGITVKDSTVATVRGGQIVASNSISFHLGR